MTQGTPTMTGTPLADEEWLVARVSQDTKIIGIDHPTEADWNDVLQAHIALRDRLNERIAEQTNCPFMPPGTDTRAEVEQEIAKRFDHIRSDLNNISRAIEDEGDRAYFGSTNDADELRKIAQKFEDWILRHERGEHRSNGDVNR